MTAGAGQRVYVAGHRGLVGAAFVRRWGCRAALDVLTAGRGELDLTDSHAVQAWLARERPDDVIIAAGRVGGIKANATSPADFIYENLMIEANLIHGSWKAGVRRLLNFGSSCMYPRHCPQPMTPELLMTGEVEPTSAPYAVAKWAGLTLCASYHRQYRVRFLTAIPCTVYGPGDSFDPDASHVISALIRKLHQAREQGRRDVTLWGSGAAQREFLYVDDLTEACEILLRDGEGNEPVNIGSDDSCTIRELAERIAEVVGFRGEICWDHSQPDGAPEKRLNSEPMRALGWSPRTDLRTGLEATYHWFLSSHDAATDGATASVSCQAECDPTARPRANEGRKD